MHQRDYHLAHELYRRIIQDDAPCTVDQIARRSKLTRSTIYKHCEGRRPVHARDVPQYYVGSRDLELYAVLIGAPDVGVVLSRRPASEVTSDNMRGATLQVMFEAGQLAGAVDQAEADGIVTSSEESSIRKMIDELERKAESLRQVLKARRVHVVGSER